MWLTPIAVALAAPADHKPTKTTEHCSLFLAPALSNGVVPMVAECVWPGLTVAKVDPIFADWSHHDEFFSSIASSDVERTDGGATIVRQVHVAKGISDREALLRGEKTAIPNGVRFSWKLEPGFATTDDGRVAVAWDVGSWEFTDGADGLHVVHRLEYDPGGSVPGFLVRWFQTSGLEAVVTELESWMTQH